MKSILFLVVLFTRLIVPFLVVWLGSKLLVYIVNKVSEKAGNTVKSFISKPVVFFFLVFFLIWLTFLPEGALSFLPQLLAAGLSVYVGLKLFVWIISKFSKKASDKLNDYLFSTKVFGILMIVVFLILVLQMDFTAFQPEEAEILLSE